MGTPFKVSSKRPEKPGIDLIPGFVVQRVIHYTTAAPNSTGNLCRQVLNNGDYSVLCNDIELASHAK